MAAWLGPVGLRVLGALFLLAAVGIGAKFLRFRAGDVGGFKGAVWWNGMRAVHVVTWTVFGCLALWGLPGAWGVLALDLVLSILATSWHYLK